MTKSLSQTLASYGDLRDARSDRGPLPQRNDPAPQARPESYTRRFLPKAFFKSSAPPSFSDSDHAEAASLLHNEGGGSDGGSVSSGGGSYGFVSRSGGGTVVSSASSFASAMPGMGPVRRLRPPSWAQEMCAVRRRVYGGAAAAGGRGTGPGFGTPEEMRSRRRRQQCVGYLLAAAAVSVVVLSASFVLFPHSKAPPSKQTLSLTGTSYYARQDGTLGGRAATNTHAGSLVRDEVTRPTVRGGMAGRAQNRYEAPGGEAKSAAAAAGLSSWEHNAVASTGRGAATQVGESSTGSLAAKRPQHESEAVVDAIQKTSVVGARAAIPSGPGVDGTFRQQVQSSTGKKLTKTERAMLKEIPPALRDLSDLTTPYDPALELPYFWDVHFSGESVAERYFAKCHGLVQAAEHGLRQANFNEDALEVFSYKGSKFVNVDMSTKDGVDRAKRLGLTYTASTGGASGDDYGDEEPAVKADVVVSPALHTAASIFHPSKRGRMFAIFRHPVDRAVSMYYYLSQASWDQLYDPRLKDMTLAEYAKSAAIEHNWATRFLIDKPSGGLTKTDMSLAKRILRRKVLIGLYGEMDTSLARFQRYFGWDVDGNPDNDTPAERENMVKCRGAIVKAGDKRLKDHPTVEKGSPEWEAIAEKNKYDLALYEYATKLYAKQAKEIFGVV